MTGPVHYGIFGLDGRVEDCADLPIDAISLGEGVFETLLVISGRPVLPDLHARRIAASCNALGIASQQDARDLFRMALSLCVEIRAPRARLRTALFAGGETPPMIIAAARPADLPPAEVRLAIAAGRRISGAPEAVHKTSSYIGNLIALRRARADGFHDALWLDDRGNIAETSTANIFFHAGGDIFTPAEGALLPGIIRGWILEHAGGFGVAVHENDIRPEELAAFEHAFLTNSVVGIVPVLAAGDADFADPRGEGWYERIAAAYGRILRRVAGAEDGAV